MLTPFVRLLGEPGEVNLFSLFQVCGVGGLVVVSWGFFSLCTCVFTLSAMKVELNPEN